MSEIAENVGIKGPVLHYYFRTKDKMFQAGFGDIILSVLTKIEIIMTDTDKSLSERIGNLVDAYFKLFIGNPKLPMFILGEIQRDTEYILTTIKELHVDNYLYSIRNAIIKEMDEGKMKQMPLPYIIFTFYGLLSVPFLIKNAALRISLENEQYFEELITNWKPYIVDQMCHLLTTDK